jgi:hypothetical protein
LSRKDNPFRVDFPRSDVWSRSRQEGYNIRVRIAGFTGTPPVSPASKYARKLRQVRMT